MPISSCGKSELKLFFWAGAAAATPVGADMVLLVIARYTRRAAARPNNPCGQSIRIVTSTMSEARSW